MTFVLLLFLLLLLLLPLVVHTNVCKESDKIQTKFKQLWVLSTKYVSMKNLKKDFVAFLAGLKAFYLLQNFATICNKHYIYEGNFVYSQSLSQLVEVFGRMISIVRKLH